MSDDTEHVTPGDLMEIMRPKFTRDDVRDLRATAEDYDHPPTKDFLVSLADRIEALLPPDTGFTVTKPAEHASGSSGGSFSATTPAPPTEDQ